MSDENTNRIATILVGCDFSPSSRAALQHAGAIAQHHHASIRVANVIDLDGDALPPNMRTTVQTNLDRFCASAGLGDDIKVTAMFDLGRPWEVLVAEGDEADLIVLGTHGHTVYQHTLLGSTSDRVVRSATTPVITVREQASDHPKLETILLATDFSSEAMAAARFAMALAPAKSHIVVVHAVAPVVVMEGFLPCEGMNPPIVETDDAARELTDSLADDLRHAGHRVSTVVSPGFPAATINSMAREIDADLIAMGTHGRTGLGRLMLGSVAARVLHHAPCPVLTVRKSDAAGGTSAETP